MVEKATKNTISGSGSGLYNFLQFSARPTLAGGGGLLVSGVWPPGILVTTVPQSDPPHRQVETGGSITNIHRLWGPSADRPGWGAAGRGIIRTGLHGQLHKVLFFRHWNKRRRQAIAMMAVNLPLLLLLPVILAESIIDHIRTRSDLSQVSIFDTTRNWRLSESYVKGNVFLVNVY